MEAWCLFVNDRTRTQLRRFPLKIPSFCVGRATHFVNPGHKCRDISALLASRPKPYFVTATALDGSEATTPSASPEQKDAQHVRHHGDYRKSRRRSRAPASG